MEGSDPLNRIATDKDLRKIAEEVGSGWEMLATFLDISVIKIEHIKEENRRTSERIYQVFMIWRQKQADQATLRNLFYHMFEAGLLVHWSKEGVARALKVTEKQIKNCSDPLNRIATDEDFHTIAEEVGSGWESLATFLDVSQAKIDQIKEENRQTAKRICQVFLIWKQKQADQATLRNLLYHMFETGLTVNWSIEGVARSLKVTEEQIRNCSDPLNRKATIQDLQKIAEEIGSGWEMFFAKVLETKQEQIKEANWQTAERIYQLFLIWRQKQADRATLRNLLYQMFETGLATNCSGEEVARALKVTEEQIRNFKISDNTDSRRSGPERAAADIETTPLSTRDDSLGATVYDGRLIQLDKTEMSMISEACPEMQNLIRHRTSGTVYYVKQELVKRLGMDVAVKKVTGSRNFVRKEMIVSRILHPFIVPMLTSFRRKENTFYFVYPFFAKRDLHGVLRECQNDPTSFNAVRRIRVCYQVASALKYLHTEVPEVRSAVLHKDVCSQNILLDVYYNARLTDSGMARDDTTSTASVRHTYSHPDIGKPGKPASRHWDYFAFGVVIREILTGLDPTGTGICFLKYMTQDLERPGSCYLSNVSEDQLYVGDVWPKNGSDVVKDLCTISTECLRVQADNNSSFDFAKIVGKLKEIIEEFEIDVMVRDKTTKSESMKCDVCMFNEAAKSTHRRTCYVGCTQPMQICMPCEKNSSLNPLTCYTCGSVLKREIGDDWGALLVAGPDEDENSAKAFMKDVEKVKRVITSKAPMIMGIREQYIKEVFPGTEAIVPRILHALKEIGKEDITTLFIYFSCHGKEKTIHVRKGDGQEEYVEEDYRFELGSETLSLKRFENELAKLSKVKSFIIILDACFAHMVHIEGKNVLQINSCAEGQKSTTTADGSTFANCLINGLKGISERFSCIQENKEGTCELCNKFLRTGNDFLSFESLFQYIRVHVEEESHIKGDIQTPKMYVGSDKVNVAYTTNRPVFIEFEVEDTEPRETVQVCLEDFTDLGPLRKRLYEECGRDESKEKMSIMAKKYRGDEPEVKCDSLKKVMAAWINRNQLLVKFEQ